MKSNKWIKEIARDSIALGSIPFYFILIIRAVIGKYNIFVYQLLIALAVLVGFSFIVKKSNMHIARCFVLWMFSSLFYKDTLFTVFAFILWVVVVISSYYLKAKKSAIIKGVLLGLLSSGAAYYLAGMI
ncbi:MAG: hypothetical protein QF362_00900 [Candidatus Woesearchaeota archaeon]|jgi:uncharacterized membrane protein|nr:hypothetical protein [Candidatus Woesearchaeota archaeon]MDP7505988.1 hypothetical protein [Candidatus Woesearchaeota archaeon]MDP7610451.1 hypothetical protein [Candidatus Woesearchaeota archaeon]|tara:strand:- start:1684 stop:2070 length:387 start_codon:yes stop_codon:yes gene_type:complete